jgi:type I restriction enzyme, R subunit
MSQSEQELEQNLIDRLNGLGYEGVKISNAEDLKANLKTQLEKHNSIQLSTTEFRSILNHLDKGNVFDRAKRLRDKMELSRDNGTTFYLEFLIPNQLIIATHQAP